MRLKCLLVTRVVTVLTKLAFSGSSITALYKGSSVTNMLIISITECKLRNESIETGKSLKQIALIVIYCLGTYGASSHLEYSS